VCLIGASLQCIILVVFKVRSVFSQVIIAMAHHQYLAHEGAQMLIEYIVRQCGLNTSIIPKVRTCVVVECECILQTN